MHRIAHRLAHLLALAVLSAAAFAQAPSTAPDPRIDQLMERSGLNRQLALIPKALSAGIEQSQSVEIPGPKLTAAQVAQLKGAVTISFGADRLRDECRRTFAEVLLPGELDAVLRWLATPLGTKITRMEVKAEEELVTAADYEKRKADAKAIAAGASAERRAFAERIIGASLAAEVGASIMVNIASGVAYGVALALSPDDLSVPTEMRRMLEAQRPRFAAAVRTDLVHGALYMYRSLPDTEFAQYAAFLESTEGQAYNAAAFQALDRAFSKGGVDLATRFGAALPRQGAVTGS